MITPLPSEFIAFRLWLVAQLKADVNARKILHGVNAFVIAVRKPIIHTKIKFVFAYGRVAAFDF